MSIEHEAADRLAEEILDRNPLLSKRQAKNLAAHLILSMIFPDMEKKIADYVLSIDKGLLTEEQIGALSDMEDPVAVGILSNTEALVSVVASNPPDIPSFMLRARISA